MYNYEFESLFVAGLDAVIVSDSMTKNLGPMKKFKVYTYRGCDVRKLLLHLIKDSSIIRGYEYVFVHIGTNNFGNSEEWKLYNRFRKGQVSEVELQAYGNSVSQQGKSELSVAEFSLLLGKVLRQIKAINPGCKLFCSAIIPRYWDFNRRDGIRRQFNSVIEEQAMKYGAWFVKTYSVFFKGYSLKEHFFDEDGLHLSTAGGLALGGFFSDKLHKAKAGLLH